MRDNGEAKERIVCDYVGAMTDRFAIAKYEELFIPKSWHGWNTKWKSGMLDYITWDFSYFV